MKRLRNPNYTKLIRTLLDDFLPPIIRDQRWFYGTVVKLWNRSMDIDFKEKAFSMTEEEFIAAYENLSTPRDSDMTPRTKAFVLSHLIGNTLLEVGAGNGEIAHECAQLGLTVTATEINSTLVKGLEKYTHPSFFQVLRANVEKLPFPSDSFDTVLCLHTLEHTQNLHKAIGELKRVTRQRLIVIVPRQRYFRYTADYHLHFFPSSAQLGGILNFEQYHMEELDFCLCFVGKFPLKNRP